MILHSVSPLLEVGVLGWLRDGIRLALASAACCADHALGLCSEDCHTCASGSRRELRASDGHSVPAPMLQNVPARAGPTGIAWNHPNGEVSLAQSTPSRATCRVRPTDRMLLQTSRPDTLLRYGGLATG